MIDKETFVRYANLMPWDVNPSLWTGAAVFMSSRSSAWHAANLRYGTIEGQEHGISTSPARITRCNLRRPFDSHHYTLMALVLESMEESTMVINAAHRNRSNSDGLVIGHLGCDAAALITDISMAPYVNDRFADGIPDVVIERLETSELLRTPPDIYWASGLLRLTFSDFRLVPKGSEPLDRNQLWRPCQIPKAKEIDDER